ncbi:RDD family protein [Consotaella aegiceratis]|uniref:RDD family protein n=1 Tax=Consotaella aegiceratis TaxID=3097961 RepID=UPI002F4116A1
MSQQAAATFTQGDLDRPRLYDGVRTRRIMAFVFDYVLIALLTIPAALVVFLLGIVTLGLGWLLFAVLIPVLAALYVGFTMGGPRHATPGMRLAGIRLERLDGGTVDPVFAVLHGVLFWAGNAVLSPAIILVGLFTSRKQLVHDLLLNTVMIRDDRWDAR